MRRRSASGGRGHWVARARSLSEFQTSFPDATSCAAFLFERRWPQGFVCPACGAGRAAFLRSRAHTYECLDCGRQTSAHRHVSQRVCLPIQSALLPTRLAFETMLGLALTPSPDELLGYRRARQSPQRRADSPAPAAAPKDSDWHPGRRIKTSRKTRTQPRFGI